MVTLSSGAICRYPTKGLSPGFAAIWESCDSAEKPTTRHDPNAAAPTSNERRDTGRSRSSDARDKCSILCSQDPSGFMNGRANALICIAATQISAHRIVDFRIGRLAVRVQQTNRGHHLTGLTIPALRNIQLRPRCLDYFGHPPRGSLNRHDGPVDNIANARLTGSRRLAIQMHGARTAESLAAAVLRAIQRSVIPKHPK